MTPRRIVVLLTLIVGVALAVMLPVASGGYTPTPVQETNGVPDGSSASQPGHAAAGKKLFVTFCGKCHVMQVANTKGTIGPNLDRDSGQLHQRDQRGRSGRRRHQASTCCALTSRSSRVAKFVTTQRR